MAKSTSNENTGISHETDRSALIEWTNFKDAYEIVKPYVTEVISKAVYGGYPNARQVFQDYKICNVLRIKLIQERVKITVAIYVNEQIYHSALQIKAKMLATFSSMLSDATLHDQHKGWIHEQLKGSVDDEEVNSADFIKRLGTTVKGMDEDVQSEINKQKEEKLKDLERFHHGEKEFQADNLVKKMKEFEDLNDAISSVEGYLVSLGKHASNCGRTLRNIEERTTSKLEVVFYELLPENEDDIGMEWLVETDRMGNLAIVQKEKAKSQNKIMASSGLCH